MPEPSTSDALENLYRQFETAFNAGDLAALVDLYEPDAVVMSAPGEIVRGHEQIRYAFEQILAERPKVRIKTVASAEGPGGIALRESKWTITVQQEDGTLTARGANSAEVLRRQPDGRWLYIIGNPFSE